MYSHSHEKDHDHLHEFRNHLKKKAEIANGTYRNPDEIKIFDTCKMYEIMRIHCPKSNLHRNHRRFTDFLTNTAGYLHLAEIPTNIYDQLDNLQELFPNFSEVLDYYRIQIALSKMTARPVFSANPLLIAGDPGIGKTAFCHALAKIIKTHFELISLSGMSAGFVIGGMSSNWADGKPGKVVEALARNRIANPIIVIDEIDKASSDARYDPLGPLHQLLEKETSSKFIDEGLEIPVDCSHIVWVATCNEVNRIPDPILSRFKLIDVKKPTPEQMEKVLKSIYGRVRANYSWGDLFKKDISPCVIDKIINSGMEPRLIQQELVSACGKAALRSTNQEYTKESCEIEWDDFEPQETRGGKIGFL